MVTRRDFLKTTAGGLVLAGTGSLASALASAANPQFGPSELPSGMLESSLMEALAGKVPLIKKTFRPPNYETPVSYFNEALTVGEIGNKKVRGHGLHFYIDSSTSLGLFC
jgi:hypothetical protein